MENIHVKPPIFLETVIFLEINWRFSTSPVPIDVFVVNELYKIHFARCWRDFYWHLEKAKEICLSVSGLYSQKMLLHGDLHHDNILLSNDGSYIIIDSKGVIGDPVFDVPRLILNEFGEAITPALYGKIK